MKNHTNDCAILKTGWCTCGPQEQVQKDIEDYTHRFGQPPNPMQLGAFQRMKAERATRAGTSRHIDTDERVTWLGDVRIVHPPTCAVYKAGPNWAGHCDCAISKMQRLDLAMVDPADVPKENRPEVKPGWVQSRAPWWVWIIVGMGAGIPLGAAAGWPW